MVYPGEVIATALQYCYLLTQAFLLVLPWLIVDENFDCFFVNFPCVSDTKYLSRSLDVNIEDLKNEQKYYKGPIPNVQSVCIV